MSDLDQGRDVPGVVEPPVPAAVEAVPVVVPAAHVDGCGAGVAGEVVLGAEPSYVPDLPEDQGSADGPDPADLVDVRGLLGHRELDLLGGGLDLRVELGDVPGVLQRGRAGTGRPLAVSRWRLLTAAGAPTNW